MNDNFSRREFLSSSIAIALSAAPTAQGCAPPAPSLHELSATDAVAAMKRGDFTAELYATQLVERCKAATSLNAFITLRPDSVLEAARLADARRQAGGKLGPLHGLPIPAKDSINTKDLPTSGGTRALRDFHPRVDAPLIARLRDAGAILLGKTNLHELSMGYTSANLTTGAVHNPYDTTRVPGGSSGGSAAAVAARLAPLSVAEDTAGSIRIPAAMCGVVGFRPTTHRYPSQGVLPMSAHFDQLGPHARTVRDAILFDAVATGDRAPIKPASLRGVKLAVLRDYYFADLDDEVSRVIDDALRRLQDAGARIVEAKIPDLGELVGKTAFPVILHDLAPAIGKYLAEFGAGVSVEQVFAQVGRDIQDNMADAKAMTPSDADYRTLTTLTRPLLQARFADVFKSTGARAIVLPTAPLPAPTIAPPRMIKVGGQDLLFDAFFGRNVMPGSTAGLPGLVLPAGLTQAGLPVGIEFDGPAHADRSLLALGLALERALGPIPAPKFS